MVKNLLKPHLYTLGFQGIGRYSSTKDKKAYSVWASMLQRCYCTKFHIKHPSYINCTTRDEWHNFQNFAKWFYKESNFEKGLQLDKDLIVQGNSVYSEKTCIFVSPSVNLAITDTKAKRGRYKPGVSFHKGANKFQAGYKNGKGKRLHIGTYNTESEAYEEYKNHKYKALKKLALQQNNETVKRGLLSWVIPET
jgi:hypothetical protein